MKRLFLLTALSLVLLPSLSAQDFTNFRIPDRIVSPEFVADTVILRFPGEYVSDVRVEGSWLDTPALMNKREGVWELKLTGMQGDFYTYRYIVDGVPSLDPSNHDVQYHGTDYCNFFIVDGPRSQGYVQASHRG